MKISAGLLMYRVKNGIPQVLLVHPGGPFWKNKDEGAWSIPKGEVAEGEDLLDAARREFEEELGFAPQGPFTPLSPVRQKGGKVIHAWSFQGDCDPAAIRCNTFTIEWPPRSGQQATFPEVDRAEFFDLPAARKKINPAQVAFIDEMALSSSACPLYGSPTHGSSNQPGRTGRNGARGTAHRPVDGANDRGGRSGPPADAGR